MIKTLPLLALLLSAALPGAALPGSAMAQPGLLGAPARPANDFTGRDTVRVDLSGNMAETRTLNLPRGKSAVIELPTDARDVLVSDPKVADVMLSTPRRIYVLGVGGGQTDAAFFDAAGRQLLRLNIRVDQDISALGETLNRVLPGSTIHVDAVNQSVVLSGEVPNAATADKAMRLAQGFVAKPEQVIDMLSVTESEQVMLKVRIIEVNRQVVKQLGINLNAILGQLGNSQFIFSQLPTYGVNGSLLGGVTSGYQNLQTKTNPTTGLQSTNNQFGANIEAFERAGLVRNLAEPNLTAVSGEAAKFLVGGEFPVPIGEDATGRVTVDFKQYGVGLGFTPVVMSKGRISLKLSAEVSELTNTGAFTLANSTTTTAGVTSTAPSLVIPGLTVRRAETTVEMPSGQSLMIAGLLQSTSQQTLDSLPGLMQVPILGALFRSRDFLQGDTELVVIITPYLVKPTSPGQLQTPADGLTLASDLETNLLGRLNKSVGKTAPTDKTYKGPFGYVVE